MKEFRLKSIDYENRYIQAKFSKKQIIKANKKKISRYERVLSKRELKRQLMNQEHE